MLENDFWVLWLRYFNKLVIPATFATLRMVIATMLIGFILGFGLSVLMTIYRPAGLNLRKIDMYNVIHYIHRRGQCSIRINDQFRVCFIWTPEGPERVEITDYH